MQTRDEKKTMCINKSLEFVHTINVMQPAKNGTGNNSE